MLLPKVKFWCVSGEKKPSLQNKQVAARLFFWGVADHNGIELWGPYFLKQNMGHGV